jgi:hypothetical protein
MATSMLAKMRKIRKMDFPFILKKTVLILIDDGLLMVIGLWKVNEHILSLVSLNME